MIVDDHTEVLSTIDRMLRKKGYQTETFDNPVSALERLKSAAFDLVITDLKMPQMDGLQLLYRVKQSNPGLPVVMITAYSSISTAVEAIKNGGFDYIRKPFDMQHLYGVVERALASRSPS